MMKIKYLFKIFKKRTKFEVFFVLFYSEKITEKIKYLPKQIFFKNKKKTFSKVK